MAGGLVIGLVEVVGTLGVHAVGRLIREWRQDRVYDGLDPEKKRAVLESLRRRPRSPRGQGEDGRRVGGGPRRHHRSLIPHACCRVAASRSSIRAMDSTRSLRARAALIATLAALACLTPATALAAEPTAEEKAGARAAATEANAAFDAKRYEEALDKFTRAESLVHAPTHLLMIARTQVALGQLVRGRETYNALVRETLAPNAPPVFKDAQTDGKRELDALEPRIPTLTVKLSDPAAKGVAVTMDGVAIPPALVGIARPVDPGKHVFKATGDGVVADETPVEVRESERSEVVLKLRSDPNAKAPAPETPPGGETPPPAGGGDDTLMWLGWGGVGLGVVGIGVGAVFMGLGGSARSDADAAYDACTTADPCPQGSARAQEVIDLDDDANGKQTIGLIGFIAGGAFAAAGVTLLVLSAGDDAPSDATATVTPWIGVGSAGARGTF